MDLIKFRLLIVFVIGWLSYASTYFLKKPLGIIKSDLNKDLHFTKSQLGLLDTALLLPYALVQIFVGQLGDKFGARKTLSACLILAGLSMISFGIWDQFHVLAFLLLLNGTSQSLCWPLVNKGLGAWVSDIQRKTVFGYFGTCMFSGGIIGTAFAVYLEKHFGWRQVHYIPSLICISLGIIIFLFFKSPEEIKAEVPGKANSSQKTTTLTMTEIWRIPMVPEIAISLFCLKGVRYAMYMWLPMFLLQHLGYSKTNAGMFSTMFEIGGIAGSATIGYLLKTYFNNKSLWGSTIMTFLSAFSLYFFLLTANMGMFVNSLFMIISGFLNCAPDIILCGSFATELGEMDGRNAASAVIGLVNGIGSISTFIEGPIIGWLCEKFGWIAMFYFVIVISLVGTGICYRGHKIYELKLKKDSEIKLNSSVVQI